MNAQDFDKLTDTFLADLRGIQKTKGAEYCGSDDRFANFKRGAEAIGLAPETVLWIYLSKHIDSLATYVKQLTDGSTLKDIESKLSEPIEGRIKDAINYLLLLAGLTAERRKL